MARPEVLDPRDSGRDRDARGRLKPQLIPVGSAVVRVYGRHPGPWTVVWREAAHGPRMRALRVSWKAAEALAKQVATNLANGQAAMNSLTELDRLRYLRSEAQAQSIGKSLDLVMPEVLDLHNLLAEKAPGVTLRAAVEGFLEHRPQGVDPKTVPEVVDLLLKAKREGGGAGERWIRTLEHQLARFAEKFTCALGLVRAHEINNWLRGLEVGLTTRRNYRNALRELVRFAKAENYLADDWDELKRVHTPKPPLTDAHPWTPAQMTRLLACASPKLVPLVALVAFAGVRHEEISSRRKSQVVTWSDILWDEGLVRVVKHAAKTKRQRLIKMHPNLVAWLTPHAKTSGPICPLKHTGDALYRLGVKAGIPWVKNALRDGFISYRLAELKGDIAQTAREAGNSPAIIERNYLKLVTEKEAKAWFDISPAPNDRIVQLDLALGGQV